MFADLGLVVLIVIVGLVIRYLRSSKGIQMLEEFDEAAAYAIVEQECEVNGH